VIGIGVPFIFQDSASYIQSSAGVSSSKVAKEWKDSGIIGPAESATDLYQGADYYSTDDEEILPSHPLPPLIKDNEEIVPSLPLPPLIKEESSSDSSSGNSSSGRKKSKNKRNLRSVKLILIFN